MTQAPDSLLIRKADLESAVQAGILPAQTAEALVSFVLNPATAASGGSEDEQLRLVTGFGDIFVTIGLALFLGALTYLVGEKALFVIPIAAWLLAEAFTRWKRMALPSIALLAAFGISVFMSCLYVLLPGDRFNGISNNGGVVALAGLVTALAIALHWFRFRVPITVAAGAAAVIAIVVGLIGAVSLDFLERYLTLVLALLGLAVFALAMFFDMSDIQRRTQRTDIAFWLHLLAAPLIVHPLVQGLADLGNMARADATAVFALFAVLSLVALIVDRRALLVSSLSYLGYALVQVISVANVTAQSFAFAVLLVGAIVLILSLAWRPLRAMLLKIMPPFILTGVPAANATYPKAKST